MPLQGSMKEHPNNAIALHKVEKNVEICMNILKTNKYDVALLTRAMVMLTELIEELPAERFDSRAVIELYVEGNGFIENLGEKVKILEKARLSFPEVRKEAGAIAGGINSLLGGLNPFGGRNETAMIAAKQHDSVQRRILGLMSRKQRIDLMREVIDCMDLYTTERKLQGASCTILMKLIVGMGDRSFASEGAVYANADRDSLGIAENMAQFDTVSTHDYMRNISRAMSFAMLGHPHSRSVTLHWLIMHLHHERYVASDLSVFVVMKILQYWISDREVVRLAIRVLTRGFNNAKGDQLAKRRQASEK